MSAFRVRVAALVALACCSSVAAAAQFGLSNTRIQLGASHSVETVVLTNQEARDVTFEVRVKRWTQKADGTWDLVPTQDLVVHPLILKLPDTGTARLRIGSLAPTVAAEQAYRIELQELPDSPNAPAGQVRMLTMVSVPVFVEPAKAAPNLALAIDGIDHHGASLVLRNDGSAFIGPTPGKIRVRDAGGRTLHEAKLDTNYVLAGARLPLRATVPASACAGATSIELTMGDAKPLIASITPGQRRCAP
jgi:fimbrial chaperone protein